MFMHSQENLQCLIGFASRNVPFGDDRECLGARAEPSGLHPSHKLPKSLVVAHPGGDIYGVVECSGRVSVRWVAIEVVEELECHRAVVPEALEDGLDELWGPLGEVVEG